MKTLEERLKERKTTYDKLILAEHTVQKLCDLMAPVIKENSQVTIYETYSYLYLHPESIEEAELEILPLFTSLFPEEKWDKVVEEDSVHYNASVFRDGMYLRVTVTPKIAGTCRIIVRATGKVIRKSKWVDVEEPEVEYLVDCAEEKEVEEEQ
jgi:hypothetical protein